MIQFQTNQGKMYNYIIHHFLEKEVFYKDGKIYQIIEKIMPKYLYREQYEKCINTFEELYNWTEDDFIHDMKAFHELALNNFIEYMANLQHKDKNFDKKYFDKKCIQLIEEAATEECEYDDESTKEECIEMYKDIYFYIDDLFIDTDFNFLEKIYNLRKSNNPLIEQTLGINIDYYFEILPIDIQEKYKTKHITLNSEVKEMLDYIQNRVRYGNLSKLFWEEENQINEQKIQVLLDNLMSLYFYNKNVEIIREPLIGNGKVDFLLYRNNALEEKVLIEIKKASNSKLKNGLEFQITQYIKSLNYKNAIYLIICFTDEEYNKVTNFIKKHIYTEEFQMYIKIYVLDVRNKICASKISKN